jgi:ribosomal protein L7/L12
MDTLRPRIVDLLVRGRSVEAIRLVRQATGLGLQQAKDVVDAIAAEERVDPRGRRRR